MKIGVIADTHNHVARTERAMEIFIANGCEVLLPAVILQSPLSRQCGTLELSFVQLACSLRFNLSCPQAASMSAPFLLRTVT